MKLLTQQNNYECVLTSVAMCMDVTSDILREKLSHNPDDIRWPGEKEPYCRRGVQIEDLLNMIYRYGYYAMPFFKKIMVKGKVIVLTGSTPMDSRNGLLMYDNTNHVVAWNCMEKMIYDPVGVRLPYNDDWCEFWAIGRRRF